MRRAIVEMAVEPSRVRQLAEDADEQESERHVASP